MCKILYTRKFLRIRYGYYYRLPVYGLIHVPLHLRMYIKSTLKSLHVAGENVYLEVFQVGQAR